MQVVEAQADGVVPDTVDADELDVLLAPDELAFRW